MDLLYSHWSKSHQRGDPTPFRCAARLSIGLNSSIWESSFLNFIIINILIMTRVIPIWHMSNHTIWAGIMFVLKTIGLVDRMVARRATTWPGLYWTDQTNQLKHLGVWRWLCVNNVLPAGWRHFLLTSTRSQLPVCSCKHAGKSFIKHSGIKHLKKQEIKKRWVEVMVEGFFHELFLKRNWTAWRNHWSKTLERNHCYKNSRPIEEKKREKKGKLSFL